MFDDPAVRSVRVALALCDRFTELLKGPTTVRAAKRHGALVGVSGDQESLSMRIGEAQQIYPEIWQHLDDARKVFAARGIHVGAFDFIRDLEGQGLGADVGFQQHESGGVERQVKSAGFNTEGLARARQACKALMDATPDIDWKAIATAEGADPAAAEFGRSTRNKRYMRLAALALVIFAPFGIVMYMRHQKRVKMDEYRQQYEPREPYVERLADADRAGLVKLVAELRPQLIAARKSWSDAFAPAALAAIKPGTAPCSRAIQPPTQAAMDRFVRDDVTDVSFASSDFYGYPADKPIPDDVLAGSMQMVIAVEKRLASKTATRYDRDPLAAIAPAITLVLIDKEVPPEIAGAGSAMTYTPGQVLARAYVYSVRDAKIVCAGAIDAHNVAPEASPYLDALRAERDGRVLLHREMELRIRESLAKNLRAL